MTRGKFNNPKKTSKSKSAYDLEPSRESVTKDKVEWRRQLIIAFIGAGAIIIAAIIEYKKSAPNEPTPMFSLVPPINTHSVTPPPSSGTTRTSPKTGMTSIRIPEGEFRMGTGNGYLEEGPVHTVFLSEFWIDQTEVTNKMYSLCVAESVCSEPSRRNSNTRLVYYGNSEFDDYPITYIDWHMAQTYCEWLEGNLPTEAQWEKTARGTDQLMYPWGNEQPNRDFLNYSRNENDTTKVGTYDKNISPYGAMDMAGNVMEWTADWYSETYYSNSPTVDPQGPSYGKLKVLRGGSWFKFSDFARTTYRVRMNPFDSNSKTFDIGFRCAYPP